MTQETLFAAALEQPPTDRDRFLVEACGDDIALLERVRALLAAHTKDSSILDQPAEPPYGPSAEHFLVLDTDVATREANSIGN
jgi:hypothetical protein